MLASASSWCGRSSASSPRTWCGPSSSTTGPQPAGIRTSRASSCTRTASTTTGGWRTSGSTSSAAARRIGTDALHADATRRRYPRDPQGRLRPGRQGRSAPTYRASLTDEAFLATHLKDRAAGADPREVLYEDPDLGFCICGHVYADRRTAPRTTTAPAGPSTGRPPASPR